MSTNLQTLLEYAANALSYVWRYAANDVRYAPNDKAGEDTNLSDDVNVCFTTNFRFPKPETMLPRNATSFAKEVEAASGGRGGTPT